MPTQALEALLALLLTVLFLVLLLELGRIDDGPTPPEPTRHSPRLLRPRTPNDCPHCRDVAATPSLPARVVVPYAQRKSRRGRKKTLDTLGQACANPDCDYWEITDPAVHALVGYGHHGQQDPIQDFFCQACCAPTAHRLHRVIG
jgi:hypothetical protein